MARLDPACGCVRRARGTLEGGRPPANEAPVDRPGLPVGRGAGRRGRPDDIERTRLDGTGRALAGDLGARPRRRVEEHRRGVSGQLVEDARDGAQARLVDVVGARGRHAADKEQTRAQEEDRGRPGGPHETTTLRRGYAPVKIVRILGGGLGPPSEPPPGRAPATPALEQGVDRRERRVTSGSDQEMQWRGEGRLSRSF